MGAPQHDRQLSLEQLSLQRRSFTAAALRRGTIKISEPVPVENSGPSPVWPPSAGAGLLTSPGAAFTSTGSDSASEDDDEDDDDAESVAELLGTAELVVLANNVNDQQQKNSYGTEESFATAEELRKNSEGYSTDGAMATERGLGHATTNVQSPHGVPLGYKRSSSGKDDGEEQTPSSGQRSSINDSKDVRNSAGSVSAAKKKRRSGSIRSAFKRMFSKRDKSHGEGESQPGPRHEYHKSESALHIPRSGLPRVAEEPPYQSRLEPENDYMARTQIDTPRLPFPMNINAPLSSPYKSRRNQPRTTGGQPINRQRNSSPTPRRNSLPSIVVGPAETETMGKLWTGEGAAPDARRASNLPASRTPSPLIGLAITSNKSLGMSQNKRRSRSVDALYDMAMEQSGRNPAEIKYWKSASHRISESTEQPFDVRKSHVGSIGDVDAGKGSETYPADVYEGGPALETFGYNIEHIKPHQLQVKRSSRGSRNSMERGSQTSPQIQQQEFATLNRVDRRLSQIEQNMAQLAHSMQTLSDRESFGSTASAKPPTSANFRLEKPPASKSLSSSFQQQSTQKMSSLPGGYPHPLHANPGPSLQYSQQQPQSPRHAKSTSVLVSRSMSLKQPQTVSSQHHHPRHSPSCNDLPSSSEILSKGDTIPEAVALPYVGTSLPSNVPQQYARMRQCSQPNLQEGVLTPTVHNFSTPFPAQSPTPVTPPMHLATKGTDSSGSTGSSFGAPRLASGITPPAFGQPHQRAQSTASYLTPGLQQPQLGQSIQAPNLQVTSEGSPTRFVDHLAPIYTALRHERAIRKVLEGQVMHLKRDMYELSNVVAQLIEKRQQAQHDDEKEDKNEDYWQQQIENLQQRGSGSSISGNAFAQAQARAHAEARAQGRPVDVQYDSLMAQYAAALQQEHKQHQRRSQKKSRREQQLPVRQTSQRVSWRDEQPLDRHQVEEGYEQERGGETNEDEEEDEDDLYERSGNWVAAARSTGTTTASTAGSAAGSRRRAERTNEGVMRAGQEEGDWQADMF